MTRKEADYTEREVARLHRRGEALQHGGQRLKLFAAWAEEAMRKTGKPTLGEALEALKEHDQ